MSTQAQQELIDLALDGRRWREKRGRSERFWFNFTVNTGTAIVVTPLNGYLLMMGIGVVHHEWWPVVPTIGFVWAMLVSVLTGLPIRSPMKWDKR